MVIREREDPIPLTRNANSKAMGDIGGLTNFVFTCGIQIKFSVPCKVCAAAGENGNLLLMRPMAFWVGFNTPSN
jgi:hypothetical protein